MTYDELKQYDSRTIERKLRRGLITRKDYEKYVKGLIDRAENAAPLVPRHEVEDSRDEVDEAGEEEA